MFLFLIFHVMLWLHTAFLSRSLSLSHTHTHTHTHTKTHTHRHTHSCTHARTHSCWKSTQWSCLCAWAWNNWNSSGSSCLGQTFATLLYSNVLHASTLLHSNVLNVSAIYRLSQEGSLFYYHLYQGCKEVKCTPSMSCFHAFWFAADAYIILHTYTHSHTKTHKHMHTPKCTHERENMPFLIHAGHFCMESGIMQNGRTST